MSKSKLKVERLVVGQMAANCYIISDGQESVVIDPGDDGQYILAKIETPISAIVATHGHFDHILSAMELQTSFGVPFLIHADDVFLLKGMQESSKHFLGIQSDPPPQVARTIADGEVLPLGLRVMHTPGHTPGSVTLLVDTIAFVGDVLFEGGAVGRTDFSYSDSELLAASIKKILALPSETILYSGHGISTTVELERRVHL